MVVVDTLERLANFGALYSADGVLPFSAADSASRRAWLIDWSLFALIPADIWAKGLFYALIVAGTFLFFNVFPRAAAFVAFVLLVSVHNRNPFVLYGGDSLLRLGLFWSVLLPVPKGKTVRFCNIATFGALVQLCLLYGFAGFLKSWDEWAVHKTVLQDVFTNPIYARPWAPFFLEFPQLLQSLSFLVIVLERVGWIFFIFPWATAMFRIWAFFVFVGLQIGLGLFLNLQFFPYINIVFLLILLPSEIWSSKSLPPFRNGSGWLRQLVAALAIGAVVLTNFKFLAPKGDPVREFLVGGARVVGLNQNWGLFDSVDGIYKGYFSVIAQLDSPEQLYDVLAAKRLAGGQVYFPKDSQSAQGGFLWSAFLEALYRYKNPEMNRAAIVYFCKVSRQNVPVVHSISILFHRTDQAHGDLVAQGPCDEIR
jgi:hypothetical protein